MGKGPAKLRSLQRKLHPDTKGWIMKPTSLRGIANKAASDKAHRFRNLFGMLTVGFLLWCWQFVNKRAASGVDRQDARSYQENLQENIEALVAAVKGGRYRAKLVLRRYIPKPNGKLRPLGIPAIADKLLQIGVSKLLEAIYEQDFLGCSYGYRPGVGALDAVRDLSVALKSGRYHYLVEADIRGFFDNIDHEKLIELLALRIDDKPFLKLIRKWLEAGILEPDGVVTHPEKGSPQGGSVSSMLANIYLHYTLDLWFEKRVKREYQGYARLIRYADDYVACFQQVADAQHFMQAMETRLKQFNLEVAPEKTKLLEFGIFAQQKAKVRGERAATFDFLGFTHYCSCSRDGRCFRMKRKTISKRFTVKLIGFKEWLRSNRTLTTAEIMKTTMAK